MICAVVRPYTATTTFPQAWCPSMWVYRVRGLVERVDLVDDHLDDAGFEECGEGILVLADHYTGDELHFGRYFDSLIGLLEAGFSIDLTHHALHALGSRALGFTQEMYDDSEPLDDEALAVFLEQVTDEYPHVTAMVKGISHDADTTLGWCDDQFEFEFGLEIKVGPGDSGRPRSPTPARPQPNSHSMRS